MLESMGTCYESNQNLRNSEFHSAIYCTTLLQRCHRTCVRLYELFNPFTLQIELTEKQFV